MQRGRNYLLVVAVFALASGCTGSGPTSPTSPASGPAAALLPESIEIVSANVPTGSTVKLVDCSDNWDVYSCYKDLHLTFSVRSNRNAELAFLNAEFLTSDGRVCAYSGWDVQPLFADVKQPLVAGVVATFRTTVVFLKPDCFDRLPFQAIRVVVRVIADPTPRVNDGSVIMELMKQELSTDYTFAR